MTHARPHRRRIRRRSWTGLALAVCSAPCLAAAGPPRIAVTDTPDLLDLVEIPGEALPVILGAPYDRIRAMRRRADRWEPVPFQCDPRDAAGRYQSDAAPAVIDADDECVVLRRDLGARAEHGPPAGALAELEIRDPDGTAAGWLYLGTGAAFADAPDGYVRYEQDTDEIVAANYRLAFAPEQPFRPVRLQWRTPGGFGSDVIDTFKIRHTGKFLHHFPFQRTQLDYTSRLLPVRAGPVRVIHRTDNRVYLFLGLRSPTVGIDHILYPHGFLVEVHAHLPFPLGLFFSELATRAGFDGSEAPDAGETRLRTELDAAGAILDGRSGADEARIDASGAQEIILDNRYGRMRIRLHEEPGSPIRSRVFVVDDRSALDPPEDVPGQFGNVGFHMVGWEELPTSDYRLRVEVELDASDRSQ